MGKEILVVHLFLRVVLAALDGFRICEDRAVARRVDASYKLFPQDEALQDAGRLVQGELEVPSFGCSGPCKEEAEENRIADREVNGNGDRHDIVENGMDEAQKVVLDMGTGVSGQLRFVQHELYVFIWIDDDVAIHNLVNDFQIIG